MFQRWLRPKSPAMPPKPWRICTLSPATSAISIARGQPRTLAEVLPQCAPRTLCIVEVFADDAGVATPLEALERFDRDWVAPAVEAVVHREPAKLTLVGNDRSLSFAARHRLRFWRAPRKGLEALA